MAQDPEDLQANTEKLDHKFAKLTIDGQNLDAISRDQDNWSERVLELHELESIISDTPSPLTDVTRLDIYDCSVIYIAVEQAIRKMPNMGDYRLQEIFKYCKRAVKDMSDHRECKMQSNIYPAVEAEYRKVTTAAQQNFKKL
jgi:hypothetical protein